LSKGGLVRAVDALRAHGLGGALAFAVAHRLPNLVDRATALASALAGVAVEFALVHLIVLGVVVVDHEDALRGIGALGGGRTGVVGTEDVDAEVAGGVGADAFFW